MTNFERWKSELKPDDLIRYDIRCNRKVMSLDCNNCPAQGECPFIYAIKHIGEFKTMAAHETAQEINVRRCEEVFLAWANKEATK